ncbi:MAG: hypothetical protein MUF48_10960 [Pirellulaceae bacterium]|nr:hypothetical protein [Pirellulaceae bacterium]
MKKSWAVWGLLFLAGLSIGLLFAPRPAAEPLLAMTAQGSSKKSMATVPLDVGMEAVITLDHVTCDLTGYVLDRFTGKFFLQYHWNVAQDFQVRPGSVPHFLLVTGTATFRNFSSNERLADGVVYISEETSDRVVAYAIPWNSTMRASNTLPQVRSFLPLDFARTRAMPIF